MVRPSVLVALFSSCQALKLVVLGPGDPWLSLCTAKTAHGRGMEATCVTRNPSEAARMLWGKESTSEESPVALGDGPEYIGAALSEAEAIVLNGAEFGGLKEAFATAVLRNAPQVARLTLCVEAGESAGAVDACRSTCQDRRIPLNVLRVGKLKGGGPGEDGSEDVGLSRHFYDTQGDLLKFQSDSYADNYLLGLSAKPGDAPVNFFQKVVAGQKQDRADGVSNRAVAAKALVASVEGDTTGLDLTLNVENGKADALITESADWASFFKDAAAGSAIVSGELD